MYNNSSLPFLYRITVRLEIAGRLTRPVGLSVSLTQPVSLPVSLTRPVGLPLSPNLIDLAHRKQVVRLSIAEPSRQCKRESEVPR